MYALYKQATDGANMQPKPGMFDFVGKAKWEAWMKLSSLSADEAKQQYCDLIDGLAKSSGMQSTAGSAPTPATPSSPNEGVKFTQRYVAQRVVASMNHGAQHALTAEE
ncbi:hypothetical protein DYB32_004475 [Aphanomyces invadans]|uniref:ACB domain-containing protein n=1 Tax=Aphanomyces invadans TaxID=157072 RepID=A0A418AXH3_9STRA|nr:hypothetical protein DYB32_004475 [Aphanomyces invadans]